VTVGARCALHPSRPAVAECGTCGRPRCVVDVERHDGQGCGICRAAAVATGGRDSRAVRSIRSTAAVLLVVPVCGAVVTQYVGAGTYGLLVPALGGVVVTEVALRGAGRRAVTGWGSALALGLLALAGAVLSVAAGVAFTPGPTSLLESPGRVLPGCAAAALAALAWYVAAVTGPADRARHGR
jgi:hypothetical protein